MLYISIYSTENSMKPLALIATLTLIASSALADPRPISCVDTTIDNPPIDKASTAQCSPRPDGGQTCRSYWLNSGNLASESQRDDQGREQGISKTYYSNGSLKTTTAYQNGKKHGIAQSYAADGTLQATTHYCQDTECAPAQK